MFTRNPLSRVCVSLAVLSCFALLDARQGAAQSSSASSGSKANPQATGDRPPSLPTDPAAWVNSAPISLEALRGKGVFLWYFEETCPKCRERWKEILPMAQKYEGKPVVFIAINSGTSRSDVEQYARDVGVNWPIIVDSDRSYEKQSDIGTISLQNIFQPRIIKADGRWAKADWENLEPGVDKALEGAAWKVDPKSIPAALRDAWLAIEFGNYAAAGTTVKRSLGSPKPDIKAGAQALQAYVQKEIDKCAAFAEQDLEKGNKYKAYEWDEYIFQTFRGFDLPAEIVKHRKELAGDPAVKAGMVASKSVDAARRTLASGNAAARKRVAAAMEKVVKDYPSTSLGDRANEVLQAAEK